MNTKTEFSQGDWEQDEQGDGPILIYNNDFIICEINEYFKESDTEPCMATYQSQEERLANARLICAAPLLLKAALNFITKVEDGRARSVESYNEFKKAIDTALNE